MDPTTTKHTLRIKERFKVAYGLLLIAQLGLLKKICKLIGSRKLILGVQIKLVKHTGLFDSLFYLENNGDVAEKKLLPLRHYIEYGDREGRLPNPLFDPDYYRIKNPGIRIKTNSLLHYYFVGRYLRTSPSPWFDVNYYLTINKDVFRSGIEPIKHFLEYGGFEGRSPCQQFDSAYYLRRNRDVKAAKLNPLTHYLIQGRSEGRPAVPDPHLDDENDFPDGFFPNESIIDRYNNLQDAFSRSRIVDAEVDVIVPVYKGKTETLNCLYSVLSASCDISFELVVINDASPDTELVEEIEKLADRGLLTLVHNSNNLGFVATVNKGMLLHLDRDVVLLNSDTEVYDEWLDRLKRAISRNNRTGTATPLSNNATICSYPRFLHDNPYPLEIPYSELDSITADVNKEIEVEVPTGVGFCMYIKRSCIEDVGLFDEKTFGKGYGEENDFCQRAIRRGWRNIIAADIFIRHWGGASFQGEKAKRVQYAMKIMDKKYPLFHQDVATFINLDPMHEVRHRIDWLRLKRQCRDKNVIIVCHNRGGGTERHIQEDIQNFISSGYSVFLLRPVTGDTSRVQIAHAVISNLPNLPSFVLSDTNILANALAELKITEIHTHSLVDFISNAPVFLAKLVKAIGAKWEINLHDYKTICPRINLIDENGFYCGEPNEDLCNQCLSSRGSDFGVKNINHWRAMHENALKLGDKVFVPDDDVSNRLSHYYPDINFEISPHEKIDIKPLQIKYAKVNYSEKVRVVVIGAIGKMKGFDVLLACAKDTVKRKLPIEFIVLGYSMNDRVLEDSGVTVTGKYNENDALDKLEGLQPNLIWLPSLWPETYSYTLSIALKAGYPVSSFDLGAIPARLNRLNLGTYILPLEKARQPRFVNDFFLKSFCTTDR